MNLKNILMMKLYRVAFKDTFSIHFPFEIVFDPDKSGRHNTK